MHLTAETDVTRNSAVTLRVEWTWVLTALVIGILFVPARIYALPISLPFELDLYRLVLLVSLVLWVFALLSSGARLRTTGLEGPLALFGIALVGSIVANPTRVDVYQQEVLKTLAIFATFVLTLYFTVSVVRRLEDAETVLRVLVLGGGALGVFAVVESRTGWTPFHDLDAYLPFLNKDVELLFGGLATRGSNFRAAASTEHPIELGALLAMLAPISAALAIRAKRLIWWIALAALVIGAVSTVSRTAVVMLVVGFALFCVLRWDDSKRFIPLALAVMAAVHLAVPGTLGTLRRGLAPSFISQEQRGEEITLAAGGRITDLSPSFKEFQAKPMFGYGVGTRIVYGESTNTRILDDQWLASLLDAGILSVIALFWLFVRFVGRLARVSSSILSSEGVIPAALAASTFAYGVGAFFYDSFSFPQVTLVFMILLAVGCALALAPGRIFTALPDPIVASGRARRESLRQRVTTLRSRRRSRVAEQLERVQDYRSGRFDDTDRR